MLLLVEPPAPDVVAAVLTMSAVEPNLSPYTVLAAIVPVATEVALTVPVVTVEVRYWELDDPPKAGPTTTSATAPMPTRISAIAANLSFIHPCLSSLDEPPLPIASARWGRPHDVCAKRLNLP